MVKWLGSFFGVGMRSGAGQSNGRTRVLKAVRRIKPCQSLVFKGTWRLLLIASMQTLGAIDVQLSGDSSVDDLFSGPAVRRINIQIQPEKLRQLRQSPREYVEAIVQEDGQT
jgi:hypothetical protein